MLALMSVHSAAVLIASGTAPGACSTSTVLSIANPHGANPKKQKPAVTASNLNAAVRAIADTIAYFPGITDTVSTHNVNCSCPVDHLCVLHVSPSPTL